MAGVVVVESVNSFTPSELALTFDSQCSVRKGVIIEWDADKDVRVLWWVDSLTPEIRERLLLAAESKGTLRLVWAGEVPSNYREGSMVDVRDVQSEYGDSWVVGTSYDIRDCKGTVGETITGRQRVRVTRSCADCKGVFLANASDPTRLCSSCLGPPIREFPAPPAMGTDPIPF